MLLPWGREGDGPSNPQIRRPFPEGRLVSERRPPGHGRTIVLALLLVGVAACGSSLAGAAEPPPDPAATLEARIDTLRRQGRYPEALSRARQLLVLRRSDPRTQHYLLVNAQWLVRTMGLASALPESLRPQLVWADSIEPRIVQAWTQGRFAEGASLAQQQLGIRRRILGPKHPEVAASLDLLGLQLRAKGDYSTARPLYCEALAMQRELFGEEHRDVAATLNNLAVLLRGQGDFAGAEPLFREALALHRKLLGKEHPEVANGLNNLADLLMAKGDHTGAEPLYREALAMEPRLFPAAHPIVAASLNGLSTLLSDEKEYAEAEALCRDALDMQRKLVGGDHPNVATSLANLAALRKFLGDYTGAEPLYREAIAMLRRLLGKEHPRVADVVHNFAALLRAQGDYAGAEPLYREALDMRRKLLGEDHPDVAGSLNGLASLLGARGDYAGAEPLAAEAAAVHEQARLRVGRGIDRATFQISPYPALAAVRLELGRIPEAWPAAERALGRALFDLLVSSRQRSLSPEETAEEDSLRKLMGSLGRQLTTYETATAKDTTGQMAKRAEEMRTQVLQTEASWEAFRLKMAVKYPVAEGQAYELPRVQSVLGPEEAIVGWLDVNVRGAKDVRVYPPWGYVIRGRGPVEWRRLGKRAASSDQPAGSRADVLRAKVSRPPIRGGLPRAEAQALYKERLAPLMECLEGVRHLIVIPSGQMVGIPLEALVWNGRGDVVGERFAVSYIPSATIHTWLREKEGASGAGFLAQQVSPSRTEPAPRGNVRCLAIADPPFCPEQLSAMTSETSPAPLTSILASPGATATSSGPTFLSASDFGEPQRGDEGLIARSALAGNREALQRLKRLPATREEARIVSGLCGGGSRPLLGPEATEQELVRMAEGGELKQFQILHIATHSLVDDQRPENSAMILSQVDLPDPLEAAVAGARIYDGCVSAAEILREWKLDADLVTLSGCETALGRNVTGEGYIGLAHAFLQAGARSLLVSLWRVEDQSTSMLMGRFYESVLGGYSGVRGSDEKRAPGSAMSKVEALQEAKGWLRAWRDPRGRQLYAHPFYWAGFVLVGCSD
jgi:CHAT domain-containing protein/tetratricopeptide (TPR) repeat protein